MAKKKTTVYEGAEMHMGCHVRFVRTRLADRTLVRCPKCNFLHISIDDNKIRMENEIEAKEREAKLLVIKMKDEKFALAHSAKMDKEIAKELAANADNRYLLPRRLRSVYGETRAEGWVEESEV